MVSIKRATPKTVLKKDKNLMKIEKPKKSKISKPLKQHVAKAIKETVTIKGEKLRLHEDKVSNTEHVNKKKTKYIMPSKSINEDLVVSCLKALQQLSTQDKKKNTILEDETSIFAEIHCIKIHKERHNVKIVFPHSTCPSTGEVCLITTDLKKGKKVDHEPTIDHWEEKLRKAGVTKVKTVLPFRQLRVEYDQYELKRRLLTQHDFLMVDSRLLSRVTAHLGKIFSKKHNMLIPVRLCGKDDIKKVLDAGLQTAKLKFNVGQTSTIIIGHTGMPQKHLKENVLSLVKQLEEKYPGGEANILSISLKLPLSLSLPLYLTLRPSSSIEVPKLKQAKPKHFKEMEDELSTIPESKVRVAPDGTVHLLKSAKNYSSETENDSASDAMESEPDEEEKQSD